MRAEWSFLLSGLALSVPAALAWMLYDAGVPAAQHAVLDQFNSWLARHLQALHDSVWHNLFYVMLLTGPLFLMVRWLTPGFHATLRMFGIRRSPLKGRALCGAVLAGLSLVTLLYIAFDFITAWTGTGDPRDSWSHGYEPIWEQILFGCLVAPFVEEFIFRGFLFTGLRRWKGPVAAAIVSSFLFSIMHGYSGSGTILIACFGLLMCRLYRRTGTLLVPMGVHSLTNALLLFY